MQGAAAHGSRGSRATAPRSRRSTSRPCRAALPVSKGAGDGRVTLASCKRRSTPLALQLRTISGSSGTASSAAAPSAGTGSGSVGSAASSAALTDSTTATRTSPLSTELLIAVRGLLKAYVWGSKTRNECTVLTDSLHRILSQWNPCGGHGRIYNPTSPYSKALAPGSGCARGGASRSRRARPLALLSALGLARRGLGLSPACRAEPRRCPGLSRPSRRGESRRRRASVNSGVVVAATLVSLGSL